MSIVGVFANGTNGFGITLDKGSSLEPTPAAIIIAFFNINSP